MYNELVKLKDLQTFNLVGPTRKNLVPHHLAAQGLNKIEQIKRD